MPDGVLVIADSRDEFLDVLSGVARAVHGPGARAEKLDWVVAAACRLTGASGAIYVGFQPPEAPPVAASPGVPADDGARVLRPVLSRLLAGMGTGAPGAERLLTADDLPIETPVLRFLDRMGLRSPFGLRGVRVPSDDGSAHGAILCCHPDPHHFGSTGDVALQALAMHLGVALDNQGTMDRLAELEAVQREVVHQLQEAVRPPVPVLDRVELGVHYLPADTSAPTGGDLYDWVVLPDGDLHLAVVDIMGKGVAATKDAVGVLHALRLLALDGCPLHRMVARADALVTAHNPDLVATVVLARYRPDTGVVLLAGGGQPPPLVVSSDGRVRPVAVPGVAIGWPSAGSSEVVTCTLERNDTLILYTDGLIEATKDVLAGIEAICRAAAETVRYPAPHLARALVERCLAGAKRRDDSLALVLRRRVPPAPERVPRLGPFTYRFSPHPATVPIGRHLLGDWLEHLGLDDTDRADLLLAASEVCSNAVRHASGLPSGLELRAWAEGDSVVVEVDDDGSGFDLGDLAFEQPPDIEAERGRGLYVVQALVDRVEVRRENDRTVIRLVRQAVLPA